MTNLLRLHRRSKFFKRDFPLSEDFPDHDRHHFQKVFLHIFRKCLVKRSHIIGQYSYIQRKIRVNACWDRSRAESLTLTRIKHLSFLSRTFTDCSMVKVSNLRNMLRILELLSPGYRLRSAHTGSQKDGVEEQPLCACQPHTEGRICSEKNYLAATHGFD